MWNVFVTVKTTKNTWWTLEDHKKFYTEQKAILTARSDRLTNCVSKTSCFSFMVLELSRIEGTFQFAELEYKKVEDKIGAFPFWNVLE